MSLEVRNRCKLLDESSSDGGLISVESLHSGMVSLFEPAANDESKVNLNYVNLNQT